MKHRSSKNQAILALVILMLVGNWAWAKATPAEKQINPTTQAGAQKKTSKDIKKRLTVMTFNVENLFDTIDDPDKEDETYLPLKTKKNNPEVAMRCQLAKKDYWRKMCEETNWTERKLKLKMKRLASVINKANKMHGLDILMVQEVENREILERFRKEYLSKVFSQPAILLEGPDSRGIDTGILTNLKSKSTPTLYHIKLVANEGLPEDRIHSTRGILEAELEMPTGESVFVYSIHFPSQGSPTEARHQAITQLTELMRKRRDQGHFVIAGGDYNITRSEDAQVKYYPTLHEEFPVSHFLGCIKCRGSNYYHAARSWSFLDAIAFSKNFLDKSTDWHLDKDSIQVFNKSIYQVNRFGSPARFNMGQMKEGVSDHWPVLAQLYYKPKSEPNVEVILGDKTDVKITPIKASAKKAETTPAAKEASSSTSSTKAM